MEKELRELTRDQVAKASENAALTAGSMDMPEDFFARMAIELNKLLATRTEASRAPVHLTVPSQDDKPLIDDTLAAAIREAERVARIDLLKEMASSECRACKDNSNLIIDEESGEWAHERGEGLPNYLCQAPDVVAEKLAALGAEKEGEK